MRQLVICLVLLLLAGVARASHETDLRKQLMTNYDKNALPAVLTNVSVRFTVLHIQMDEVRQAMILDTWISMEWKDSRLSWSEEEYPQIENLAFPPGDVWKPDITLYNNAEMDNNFPLGGYKVLAFTSGMMMYVHASLTQATCVMDMTYWPHDVHNCTAKFGSWVHSGYTLDLMNKDDRVEVEFQMKEKTQNGHTLTRSLWEVLSSSVTRNSKYYDCCPEPYTDLAVNIIVERNAPAYTWTIKTPAVVLSLLTGVLFLLPPGSVEKILMGTLVLILEMLFLSYTKDIIRYSPSHTPLIVQLLGEQMLLTMVCVIISVLIVRLVRDPHSNPLPGWLQRPLSLFASCMCLSGYRKLVTSSVDGSYPRSIKGEELEMAEERGMVGSSGVGEKLSSEQAEWLLLGAILDRLFLFLYIISIIAKMVAFSAIL